MATNSDGIRVLYEMYLLPNTCVETCYVGEVPMPEVKGVKPEDIKKVLQPCFPASKPLPDVLGSGLVKIPEGTRGIVIDRKFVRSGGRLAEPYESNWFAMSRDGVMEVNRLRITKGPNAGLEGWVYTRSLGRVGGPPL